MNSDTLAGLARCSLAVEVELAGLLLDRTTRPGFASHCQGPSFLDEDRPTSHKSPIAVASLVGRAGRFFLLCFPCPARRPWPVFLIYVAVLSELLCGSCLHTSFGRS